MEPTAIPVPVNGGRTFVTGLGIAQICSWGSLYYSFPLLASAVEADLGWSRSDLYLSATIGLFLSGILAIPVGAAIDRGHGRWIMAGGSVLAGLFLLLWSTVQTSTGFYIAAAAVGALQAFTLYDATFAVIARRSGSQNARRGIAVVTLWGGLASTVFAPLVQLLLYHFGWRGTLEVLAVINLTVCAATYFYVIDPRKDASARNVHRTADTTDKKSLALVFRSRIFWGLALAFTIHAGLASAFIFHLYPMLIEFDFNEAAAVALIACIGPAQLAGRLAITFIAGEISGRRVGLLATAFLPLGLAVLYFAPTDLWGAALAVLIFGCANGAMTIVRGVAVPEMVSGQSYGTVNGIVGFCTMGAKAAAPVVAAWIWSANGGYPAVLLMSVVAAVFLLLVFWWSSWLSTSKVVPG